MKISKNVLDRAAVKVSRPESTTEVTRSGLADVRNVTQSGLGNVASEIAESRKILKAIEGHTERSSRFEMPIKRSAPTTYRFTVQRDDKGRIMEIIATPVVGV